MILEAKYFDRVPLWHEKKEYRILACLLCRRIAHRGRQQAVTCSSNERLPNVILESMATK